MEIKKVTHTCSIFGNFMMLSGSEDLLKKTFNSFECKIDEERLQPGMMSKRYVFRNKNLAIAIRAFRIDLEYAFIDDSDNALEFVEFVDNVCVLLDGIGATKGSRIAVSTVEFGDNSNNQLVEKCNNLFNINNLFGKSSKEFSLRLNHITTLLNEEFNSVVLIQDGRITNNKTKEQKDVLFFNKDINSLMTNHDERFEVKNCGKYLADLLLEVEERNKVLTEMFN